MQELLDAEVPSTSCSSEETGIGRDDCGGEHAIATVEIGVQVAAPCRNTYAPINVLPHLPPCGQTWGLGGD